MTHLRSWSLRRTSILILVSLASLTFGVWFGEHPVWLWMAVMLFIVAVSEPTGLGGIGVGAVACLLLFALLFLLHWILGKIPPRDRRLVRMGATLLVLAAFVGGIWLGYLEAVREYARCKAGGTEIRSALEAYEQGHGRYPERLTDVDPRALPGSLLMRTTMLQYQRTDDGYLVCLPGIMGSFCMTQDRNWELYGPD